MHGLLLATTCQENKATYENGLPLSNSDEFPTYTPTGRLEGIRRLAQKVGDDFLKDLALAKGSLEIKLFPSELQKLFLPEQLFYTKKG